MIIQRCPRCGSDRIRRGYRRTPWWQAIFGRYNLLCNSCNWEFVGLAIPGTVPDQSVRKRKKQPLKADQIQLPVMGQEAKRFAETQELSETGSSNEISNQNSAEIVDKSQTRLADSCAVLESQSNADEKISGAFVQAEAIAIDNLNFNETPKSSEANKFDKTITDEAAREIIVNDSIEHERTKARKRVKRKK